MLSFKSCLGAFYLFTAQFVAQTYNIRYRIL